MQFSSDKDDGDHHQDCGRSKAQNQVTHKHLWMASLYQPSTRNKLVQLQMIPGWQYGGRGMPPSASTGVEPAAVSSSVARMMRTKVFFMECSFTFEILSASLMNRRSSAKKHMSAALKQD